MKKKFYQKLRHGAERLENNCHGNIMSLPACKICSHKTRVIIDTKSNTSYYSCNFCDFISLDHTHLLSRAEEESRYRQHNNTLENEGYVSMLRKFITTYIIPYQASIKTALDFGCGSNPVLASLLQEEGIAVDTYDKFFSRNEVYINRKYDLITSTEVFEHLKEPIDSFKLLRGLLNENGILAIMTMFHPNDDKKFQDWWYRRDKTHISFYTLNTIRHLANTFDMNLIHYDEKNACILQAVSSRS